jgi:dTDP-4-amino-4,6-dideoxygalactose transaminase
MPDAIKAPPIPLSRPAMSAAEEAAAVAVLRSGWLTSGPKVKEFEAAFAAATGVADAIATSSGTAALHVGLHALGVGPGDEVITPSLTWVSAPNVICQTGARPVFCEVDPTTLDIDLDDVARLVTSRTKVIMPVDFGGRAVAMAPLMAFARARGLHVLEDASHAIGAVLHGRPVGSLADLTAFSFHPNKNITTGEGGMLVGNDPDLIRRSRSFRYHGVTRDSLNRHRNQGMLDYDAAAPGLKLVMGDIAAAVGLVQLGRLEAFITDRARLADAYFQGLAPFANAITLPAREDRPDCRHAWHLFTIRLPDRDGLRDRLAAALAEAAIGSGWHYRPVHELAWVVERGFSRPMPCTEAIGRTILSLPLFPSLGLDDVERVCATVGRFLEEQA